MQNSTHTRIGAGHISGCVRETENDTPPPSPLSLCLNNLDGNIIATFFVGFLLRFHVYKMEESLNFYAHFIHKIGNKMFGFSFWKVTV